MNDIQPPPDPMQRIAWLLGCLLDSSRERRPFGHTRVYADKGVVQRAAIYHGGAILATSGGTATVNVYDGMDTDGELIDSFRVAASTPDQHVFERGITLTTGLYVDVGDNVSSFVPYFDPVPRERG